MCEALPDFHQCQAGLVYKLSHGLWNTEGRELTYNHSKAGQGYSYSYQPITYITLMYACTDKEHL